MTRSNPWSYTATSPRQGDDWESRDLRRVVARVDELPTPPAEADDFGWEEGVLEKLRQRLNATD